MFKIIEQSENDWKYEYEGVRWFRKYEEKNGNKYLSPLNPAYPDILLDNSFDVIGIVIQKNENRKIKHYN